MGIDGIEKLKQDRIHVTFIRPTGTFVTFYYAEDVEEAKQRFQWRYGFWPDDQTIVRTVDADEASS